MSLAQVIVVLACEVSQTLELFEEGLEEVLKCLEIRDLSGLWPEMPSQQRMVSVL